MDTTIEASVARDVEQKLARLVVRSPVLPGLPITPLFDVDDLVRLELALGRASPRYTALGRASALSTR